MEFRGDELRQIVVENVSNFNKQVQEQPLQLENNLTQDDPCNLPEIPFIDPTIQLIEIKEEPAHGLKIIEVHTAYKDGEESQQDSDKKVEEPSSDEWPESPEETTEKKPTAAKNPEAPKRIRNRCRKGSLPVPLGRKRIYINPELDAEVQNLPDTHNGKVNCFRCDKEVFKKFYRFHVERSHLNVRNFICDICGRKFYSRIAIVDHMNLHMGIKPYECPFECDIKFASTATRRNHIRNFHEERKFVCEVCGKEFVDKRKMNVSLQFQIMI